VAPTLHIPPPPPFPGRLPGPPNRHGPARWSGTVNGPWASKEWWGASEDGGVGGTSLAGDAATGRGGTRQGVLRVTGRIWRTGCT
jgi:hypothetical protein